MNPRPSAAENSFVVVQHSSGRQSCWPVNRDLPDGWSATSMQGTQQECLNSLRAANPATGSVLEKSAASSAVVDSNAGKRPMPDRQLQFSLMFFGDRENDPQDDKYRLMMSAAKFADQNGFAGIWIPERHFTPFGCLYPSPSLIHAAISQCTERIRLRAGSVVMPLNDPLRVAEQWSVVDNLSGGRAEVAFASGWHPDDFALQPEAYPTRAEKMMSGIQDIQSLWNGDPVPRINGKGKTISVRTYPTPVQPKLPMWLTAAGNPETFQRAGELGFGVLTHLFNQDLEGLQQNLQRYRNAWNAAGHPAGEHRSAATLHTFVAETMDEVRQMARAPYGRYLRSNFSLLKQLALSQGQDLDLESLSSNELDEMLNYLFDKFAGNRSLMGTPETCATTCRELKAIGVTEVACLLDFGPESEDILNHLPLLAQIADACATGGLGE